MAKGFTVKANAPTKKKEEWDIDAIKERMRGKAIVFCLPGRGCSFTFLKNFVQLCFPVTIRTCLGPRRTFAPRHLQRAKFTIEE